jgi:ribosomal 50S subunit-recycling heat shock protein
MAREIPPTRSEPVRIDVLLHRLCITRSRSEAKAACDGEAILLNGRQAKASQLVAAGDTLSIRFNHRTLVVQVDELPPRSTSKKAAREMYRVLRDEPNEIS